MGWALRAIAPCVLPPRPGFWLKRKSLSSACPENSKLHKDRGDYRFGRMLHQGARPSPFQRVERATLATPPSRAAVAVRAAKKGSDGSTPPLEAVEAGNGSAAAPPPPNMGVPVATRADGKGAPCPVRPPLLPL